MILEFIKGLVGMFSDREWHTHLTHPPTSGNAEGLIGRFAAPQDIQEQK